jgi:CHAT domain-containing protein
MLHVRVKSRIVPISHHLVALRGYELDVEGVISHGRNALTDCSLAHPHRCSFLTNLANALQTRFDQSGGTEDLEDAISLHRKAFTLCPLGHPDRFLALNNLAMSLNTRFNQSGEMQDLEEAISLQREALTLHPRDHPDRSTFLVNLAVALYSRFNQSGRMEDLEDTIALQREALTLRPPGHPDRSLSLNNLAGPLYTRFKQSGRMEDLEDAIKLQREALILRPLGHPGRSMSLNDLAVALYTRFIQSGGIQDLEDAISLHRKALTLRPLGHPDHSISVTNLANALYTRFKQSGGMEDLEEAITLQREALAFRPVGHPDRSFSLNNLASTLYTRFKQSERIEDLEDAISLHRETLTLCPLGHPDRSLFLNNLANALYIHFDKSGRVEDLEEACTLHDQAANDLTSSSRDRLDAAIDWAAKARLHHHRSTLCAYSTSLRLLDRCLNLHPDVHSQHKFLATARIPRSLASDAASAAIDAGDPKAAVELLEQGRTILWTRMARYRHPLDLLRQVNSDLADRLQALTIALESLSLLSGSGPSGSEGHVVPDVEVQMKRNRRLSEELEETLGKVREIEGFSNFLQAVPFTNLQVAAAEGPVILINISDYHSDALILHNGVDDSPTIVPLPKVQREDLIHLAEQLALARAGADHSRRIFPILRDLWNNIVSPVLDRLSEMRIPKKSRVWWCPTSELCALPLHAAGPYQQGQPNLPDIHTSSYTPTLSALIRARSQLCQSAVPKLLVIGQPSESLRNVQTEVDDIQKLGDFVDIIVGPDANRDKVLHGLQQHSWVHFACHGHLGDNAQPFDAWFELHDGQSLTLLELTRAQLPDAELAFLSACHSAEGDRVTPDETIHLAAALQFCGFRSVVGTLWAMDDRDGPMVSKEFYRHMFRNQGRKADFRDSAQALNVAVRALRINRVPLERWILFVHIGA